MSVPSLYGAVEAGGTKFLCLVGSSPEQIVARTRIPTTSPDETLRKVIEFFLPYTASNRLGALGVASFGPLDLQPDSPTYGLITTTPKPGWQNIALVGVLEAALHIPIAFDTDVNAAALGEFQWGANRDCDPSFYLTIGTGIGGGFVLHGKPLHGLINPEMGHIRLPHDLRLDPFNGVCPFHGDCFEGLASGPAIQKRFNALPETVPDGDPFWEIEAQYIGAALANYILTLSPQRIVLGGGVMHRAFLFPLIRKVVQKELKGYLQHGSLAEAISEYIVPPGLGDQSGVMGALALAQVHHHSAR